MTQWNMHSGIFLLSAVWLQSLADPLSEALKPSRRSRWGNIFRIHVHNKLFSNIVTRSAQSVHLRQLLWGILSLFSSSFSTSLMIFLKSMSILPCTGQDSLVQRSYSPCMVAKSSSSKRQWQRFHFRTSLATWLLYAYRFCLSNKTAWI